MRPKKSLGQNFLKSETILKKIRVVSNSSPTQTSSEEKEIIVEIGPGKGSLTEQLLTLDKKVIAIETDAELIPILEEKFSDSINSGMLEIIHGDILKFDEKTLHNYGAPYRIVANIPYYITGAILEKFLSSSYQPTSMTLVMQHEVAQRIMAHPSTNSGQARESILSISVKVYGTPTYHGKIPARYFTPEPKVDSAILTIENISKAHFADCSEDFFFRVVKTGFAHKRKKLFSNLLILVKKEDLEPVFQKLNIDRNARAETLALSSWLALAKELGTCII